MRTWNRACVVIALGLGCTFAQTNEAKAAASDRLVAEYARYDEAARAAQVLDPQERAYYRKLFDAIDAEQWDEVERLLGERRGGLLHQIALAEYYTAATSPKVSAQQVAEWFAMGTQLPQAEQMARLGLKRGLEQTPALPEAGSFRYLGGLSKRQRPKAIEDGTMPADTREQILAKIRGDDPVGAQRLLEEVEPRLSLEALAEWRQKVAWSYYIENDDRAALDLATTVAEGRGPWVAEGEWVVGLAAWRLGDCQMAFDHFQRSAQRAENVELASAANFWAARAAVRCAEPARAEALLRAAAREDQTLYGMLAAEQLGIGLPPIAAPEPLDSREMRKLAARDDVRKVLALLEIGRVALADELLRHRMRIGPADEFDALARLAYHLGLPRAQLFAGYYVPDGARHYPALRFPRANFVPLGGWQIDPSLAFALTLQESLFQPSVVSPAKARGLMQITPITVRQHAPRLAMDASYVNLNDPKVNLAFGQRNLEMLRDHPATMGQLPKIIAAYNAGLTPVARWNEEIRDFGDPLLWMESIPYWETRGYVAVVMRNYWMYERIAGTHSPTRLALASGQWPRFPQNDGARLARADWTE